MAGNSPCSMQTIHHATHMVGQLVCDARTESHQHKPQPNPTYIFRGLDDPLSLRFTRIYGVVRLVEVAAILAFQAQALQAHDRQQRNSGSEMHQGSDGQATMHT